MDVRRSPPSGFARAGRSQVPAALTGFVRSRSFHLMIAFRPAGAVHVLFKVPRRNRAELAAVCNFLRKLTLRHGYLRLFSMLRHGVAVAIAAAVLFLGAVGYAADDGNSIQFGPPPFPMTNLVANDAQDNLFRRLHELPDTRHVLPRHHNFGFGMMNRTFDQGGWNLGFAMQGVFRDHELSESDQRRRHRRGPLRHGLLYSVQFLLRRPQQGRGRLELPVYFGLHVGMNNMSGSFSYTYQVPYVISTCRPRSVT